MKIMLIPSLVIAMWNAVAAGAEPAKPAEVVHRVGVYDSRVLAYSHFWTDAHQKQLREISAAAAQAKAAGDRATFEAKSQLLGSQQRQIHLEVFSTAPATEAMDALKERLPALRRELGVDAFISKWDAAALSAFPETSRVDVTDRLAGEFTISPARRKGLEAFKREKPLALEEARRLEQAGKL